MRRHGATGQARAGAGRDTGRPGFRGRRRRAAGRSSPRRTRFPHTGRDDVVRAVVQRVSRASVEVGGETVGAIGTGLVVLVGVTHSDIPAQAAALARKVYSLRILRDERSVAD